MTGYTSDLYMEQVINESGIKCNACSKSDCIICDNLVGCYMDVLKNNNSNEEINYGGYETETHY